MKIEANVTCFCLGTGMKFCINNFEKLDENTMDAETQLAFLVFDETKGGN
ncbi:MAG: hypothetical protein M1123_05965 [Candidatus Thermoplasmatota archaeon]|nr:hypothetical protein [Candidatus Thermoplasmatota archaeon]MCL5930808.1 hypothetical protein [Candidatus Thermoplasmatota archaeon]